MVHNSLDIRHLGKGTFGYGMPQGFSEACYKGTPSSLTFFLCHGPERTLSSFPCTQAVLSLFLFLVANHICPSSMPPHLYTHSVPHSHPLAAQSTDYPLLHQGGSVRFILPWMVVTTHHPFTPQASVAQLLRHTSLRAPGMPQSRQPSLPIRRWPQVHPRL